MSFPSLTRLGVISRLRNDQGRPIKVLPWWRNALKALDSKRLCELILKLVRQRGKSQLLAALAITELLCRPNSYTVLVAASQSQQQAIFHRKIRRPLERLLNELGLRDVARFTQSGVEIPDLNSAIEVVASVEDTTPGRTVTLLLIDEARYVADDVYASLAPSTIGAGGKVVIASTAGPPSGFFYQLVTNPTESTWLYDSPANDNPEASKGVLDFLRKRLALVAPAAARRDLDNEFAEDGDELLSAALIESSVDDTLGEITTTKLDAFAFCDLSRKRDLGSRVVVIRDSARRPEAADHLIVASIRVWDPKASPTSEVDFAEVRADLDELTKRFPNLKAFRYDEGAEAGTISAFCRQHPRLSLITEPFVANVATNMELWSALVARLNAGTLSIPHHERLLAELRGLRREEFAFGAKWRVVDGSKRYHRDVSLALAGAVMSAGQVFQCPRCLDPSCDGVGPPLGLVGSAEVRQWFATHEPVLDGDEFDDELEDMPIEAVDSPSRDSRSPDSALARAIRRPIEAFRQAAALVASISATNADRIDSAERARRREQRRAVAQREAHEREQREAEARLADSGSRFVLNHVAHRGSWFPGDY